MGALKAKGDTREAILEELSSYAAGDVDWRTGKVLTGLYDAGEGAHGLAVEAYTRFLAQNGPSTCSPDTRGFAPPVTD